MCKAFSRMKYVCIPVRSEEMSDSFCYQYVFFFSYPQKNRQPSFKRKALCNGTCLLDIQSKYFCWQTILFDWGRGEFPIFFPLPISISASLLQKKTPPPRLSRRQQVWKIRKSNGSFFFLISVCLSIQNIVGTDFLKTAAVLRGLTLNFIKYYSPFYLHQQI